MHRWILRGVDLSRLLAAPIHRMDGKRVGGGCPAGSHIWRGAPLSGWKSSDCAFDLWRDVWNSGRVAKEPAPGHDPTYGAGRDVRTCRALSQEIQIFADN